MKNKKINKLSSFQKKSNNITTLKKCKTKNFIKTISNKLKKSNSIKIQIHEKENEIELLNNKILDLKIKNYKIEKNIFQKLSNRNNLTEQKDFFLNSIKLLINKYHNLDQSLNEYKTNIKIIKNEYDKI